MQKLNKIDNFFNKDFSNYILDLQKEEEIKCISTGNISLDSALECNGIPRGRITEIYGSESSGKTTLALEIIKNCQQKENGQILFIDVEGSIDISYLKKLGIDLEKIIIARPSYGEIAFNMIEDALMNNSFDIIVVDSVAAMLSIQENEIKMEENSLIGSHARMMSRGLRRIQNHLYSSKTAIIFINQLREKIGVFFGNPENTTGGRALKFFSSLRLEIKKTDLIKSNQNKIGIKSKVTVTKNKLGKPYNSTFINIYFNEGFDYTKDVIEFAINSQIIEKKGSWFYFNDEKICQGILNLVDYFKNNKEALNILENKVNEINANKK